MISYTVNKVVGGDTSSGLVYYREGHCLSTDTKPTEGIANGSCLTEIDTGDIYLFDREGGDWVMQGSGGSGGGGLTIATITINNQTSDIAASFPRVIREEGFEGCIGDANIPQGETELLIPLYKGLALITVLDDITGDKITVSGNNAWDGEFFRIVGNGTIELEPN